MAQGRQLVLQEVNIKLWLLFWITPRSMRHFVVVKSRMGLSFAPVFEVLLSIIFMHV